MLWLFLTFSAFNSIFVSGVVEPGPRYPPTKGEVWPKPQKETKEDVYYTFNPSQFQVNVTNHNCTILTNAIQRYSYVFMNLGRILVRSRRRRQSRDVITEPPPANDNLMGNLQELQVELTAPCQEYPYFEMDESYNLTVAASSNLNSASIWGILRGLETFAQLIYPSDDYKELRINKTQIADYPRYAHRGLLLDTSRHFISLNNILTTLDAMAMNKMNVFHWHIVDDQSFPYQSEKFPDLSARGAYHPSMIYTRSDIERVIEYARDRGIRVVPEFDVPGHTRSWGVAYPNLLAECYHNDKVIGLGPMNPIRNTTYKLLRDLFREAQNVFLDKYFHVGGDEVELECWSSNPELQEYMREHNITNPAELHALFMRRVLPLLTDKYIPIVWEEVFAEGVSLSKDTLVQVWRGYQPYNTMIEILTAGYNVIYSSSWYLDQMKSEFPDYYTADPRQMVYDHTHNQTLADKIVGGEACMWGEMVDDRNFMSRIWPRASAVAERLWSPKLVMRNTFNRIEYRWDRPNIPLEAYHRMEEHVCRMIRRGVPAQPASGPGFCVG